MTDSLDATDLVRFGLLLAVLPVATTVLLRLTGVRLGWLPVVAVARAVVQLTVVAVLLRGVLAEPWTVALFVLLMLSTASFTSGGRLGDLWQGRRAAAAGVVSGAAVALAVVLALRLVAFDARHLIAVAGIIVGNAMSAATLSGRNYGRAVRARRDEVEAWLSLGATPARSTLEVGREAVRESLIPTMDQTRSTGLVTLPGAFVGALFGGAGPVEAAEFQLVVLAGIALGMSVTALVVTRIVGRAPVLPAPEGG
ncbi:MAG: ABC transporter permease [Marmoricola sp.]